MQPSPHNQFVMLQQTWSLINMTHNINDCNSYFFKGWLGVIFDQFNFSIVCICCMNMRTHCLLCITHSGCQSKLQPFSHFRLAETDIEKRKKAFLTKGDTSSTETSPQTTNPPSLREEKLPHFLTQNLGNFFSH